MTSLYVALAAGAGALCRYLLDRAVQERAGHRFPLGTAIVNLSGSFLLGVVTGLFLHHGFDSVATVVIGAGFAGGYTTLSTWAWETLALADRESIVHAAVYGAGSVLAGLAAAGAGLGLGLL